MPETSLTVDFSAEETAALDSYIAAEMPGRERARAVAEIVARWLASHPARQGPVDEGLKPEDLNASNDV